MRYLYWLGLVILAFIAIFLAPNTYYLYIIGTIAITTLVGVGLNILTGLSGQVSIGHAGFFAIGAYTGSLLMTKLQWNFWLATVIAVIVTVVTGIALAAPALRVKGPYLAMVTVAFGIIIERILIEWVDLTGGFGGIFNIPKPTLLNLQPVSLEVGQGELVAVVGANGAGKTTLLKTIARLLTLRFGQVLFRGQNLSKFSPQQLATKGVVLIPEGRQVFRQLTVIDNLRLGAFSRRDSQIEQDIKALLARFPALQTLQNQQAGLLSGGEQQMLAIARGLMARPQILLLDEPSLGLAPQLIVSLYETLASLCDEGISILLVDQMAQLAFSVADRHYVLETGKIFQAGASDRLGTKPM